MATSPFCPSSNWNSALIAKLDYTKLIIIVALEKGPDVVIAAVAVVHNLTLVTHNTADFQHIPDRRMNDWLTP